MVLLVNVVRIPPVFASRLGPVGRRRLLRRLTVDLNGMVVYESMPRVVIVDVQNGLGNRLRALASAMEFAFYTRRVLVVLWAPDAHINATMADLFHPALLRKLIVISEPVSWPIDLSDTHPRLKADVHVPLPAQHPSRTSFRLFNQMAKDTAFVTAGLTRIHNITGKHVYVKTAYVLQSRWNRDNLINAFMQQLTPAPPVMALVRRVEDAVGGPPALRAMVGVHIRSRSIVQDNDKVDHECEYSVDGAEVTDHWRRMSSPRAFIGEMHAVRRRWHKVVAASYALGRARAWSAFDSIEKANSDLGGVGSGADGADSWMRMSQAAPAVTLVDVNVAPRFFVSADSVATLERLYAEFDREDIVTLERQCDDRGAECLLYAFADIILLSRTGALLASGWSSFSEAAKRLRVRPFGMDPSRNDGYVIRTSGVDFGGPTALDRVRARVRAALWWVVRQVWAGPDLAGKRRRGGMSQEERRRICRERLVHNRQHDNKEVRSKTL